VAILIGVFESLKIKSMDYSAGALREGVLYDLVGRIRHEDVRDRTIRRLVDQYRVNESQAARVEKAALRMLADIPCGSNAERAQAGKVLAWAARLHEIGLSVSYTGYHRHGAYLVSNTYMPGFARDDQAMLAALVRGHRRKLPRDLFAELGGAGQRLARKLCALFRLAVLIHRGRSSHVVPRVEADDEFTQVTLTFPADWLARHPLTSADLRQEIKHIRSIGVTLRVVEQ
jgi:exopolyphosphatase/guanosine-5'-triphosphate,3'-diphosphate pyrophosphatase